MGFIRLHWKLLSVVGVVLVMLGGLWSRGTLSRSGLAELIAGQTVQKVKELTDKLNATEATLRVKDKQFETERSKLRQDIKVKDELIRQRDASITRLSTELGQERTKRSAIERSLAEAVAVKLSGVEIHEKLRTLGHSR